MRFGGQDKFATPKRGFVIHEDAKSGKRESKGSSTKKSRRALGDISNKQQNHRLGSGSNGTSSGKKSGLGKSNGHSKKLKGLSEKKKAKTPLKSRPVIKTSLKSKSVIEVPKVEEVPDIEVAYGGLPSSKPDSAYLAGLREELVKDLMDDKTPTLFDDFDPAGSFSWDGEKEKAMLESGEPPSPWWSLPDLKSTKGLKGDAVSEEIQEQEQEDDFGDVLPPDEFPDDPSDDFNDRLLDDLLSVDVEAACTE
ncbi:hypothetical protein PHYBOEH_002364 [Phytophthora boehmeriae]|uniref:Uncharacterized protein n=1 Tax=Phytophthora boehmeriae TaxID=109152 RepID=A0A8T1XCR5_9STRA|nr:hypothetical protein PHYBOEH_002364 [Phytophthora boehmeriae]